MGGEAAYRDGISKTDDLDTGLLDFGNFTTYVHCLQGHAACSMYLYFAPIYAQLLLYSGGIWD